jgi:hypothetical protein
MQKRPISVTIFGILNIGFGLLDVIVTLFLMVVLPKIHLPGNSVFILIRDNSWSKNTMPFDIVAAMALLAAGIGLLLSKNWARILSIIYGIYTIAVCVVGGIVTLSGGPLGFGMITSLLGSMASLIYPVLLIIFMMRPNVVAALKPVPPVA